MSANARPQLLVSVRDAADAAAALAGGVQWIDLKEPDAGPLGPVDVATAREVAELLPPATILSAAGGELSDWPCGPAREFLGVPRIRFIKLGLAGIASAGSDGAPLLRSAHDEIAAAGKELVVAAYADADAAGAPTLRDALGLAREAGCCWLLVDTFDKRGPGLLECVTPQKLAEFFAACHAHGVGTAAAGRLCRDDFRRLPLEFIDVVGVRGAVCEGDRQGAVLSHLVIAARHALAAAAQDCVDAGAVVPLV